MIKRTRLNVTIYVRCLVTTKMVCIHCAVRNTVEPQITDTSNNERKSYSPNRLHKSLDELQLTYTCYNGQNLNSPAVSVIRGSTVFVYKLTLISVSNSIWGYIFLECHNDWWLQNWKCRARKTSKFDLYYYTTFNCSESETSKGTD
jgi:hypothetical protein